MSRVVSVAAGDANGKILFRDRVTSDSRQVVRPSPDLLYSICTFDVTRYPLKITTGAPTDTYWSVSFFAENTDNFHVLNDGQAQGKSATILLIGQGQKIPPQAETVTVVSAPTTTGLVLFRTLISDDARLAEIDQQRRVAKCENVLPNEVQ
jgi:uncharacterized membrane protein